MKLQGYVLTGMLLTGAFAGQPLAAGDGPENSCASAVAAVETVYRPAMEKNYAIALSSKCDGVVESALAHVIRMRLTWPDRSYPMIEKSARRLSVDGHTVAIRYKAALASIVFDNMPMQQLSDCVNCATPEELFAKVSARIQQTALSEDR